jgi:hypothetical protein
LFRASRFVRRAGIGGRETGGAGGGEAVRGGGLTEGFESRVMVVFARRETACAFMVWVSRSARAALKFCSASKTSAALTVFPGNAVAAARAFSRVFCACVTRAAR